MLPLLTEGVATAIVMLRTVPDPVAVARIGLPASVAPQSPGCTVTAAKETLTMRNTDEKKEVFIHESFLPEGSSKQTNTT